MASGGAKRPLEASGASDDLAAAKKRALEEAKRALLSSIDAPAAVAKPAPVEEAAPEPACVDTDIVDFLKGESDAASGSFLDDDQGGWRPGVVVCKPPVYGRSEPRITYQMAQSIKSSLGSGPIDPETGLPKGARTASKASSSWSWGAHGGLAFERPEDADRKTSVSSETAKLNEAAAAILGTRGAKQSAAMASKLMGDMPGGYGEAAAPQFDAAACAAALAGRPVPQQLPARPQAPVAPPVRPPAQPAEPYLGPMY